MTFKDTYIYIIDVRIEGVNYNSINIQIIASASLIISNWRCIHVHVWGKYQHILYLYLKIDRIWDDTPKLIHNMFVTKTLFKIVIFLTNHEKKNPR